MMAVGGGAEEMIECTVGLFLFHERRMSELDQFFLRGGQVF